MAQPSFIASYRHDPGEQLDYTIQYHRLLKSGENIVSSSWSVSPIEDALFGAPTVVDDSLFDEKNATIWIKEGADGGSCLLTNRVVTNSSPPRTFERSIRILIRQS